jgi:hypothetical protein
MLPANTIKTPKPRRIPMAIYAPNLDVISTIFYYLFFEYYKYYDAYNSFIMNFDLIITNSFNKVSVTLFMQFYIPISDL